MEMGGYFELDLPILEDIHPEAIGYQSARAAIRAVLECSKAEKIFIPAYICESIIQVCRDSGLKLVTYELNEVLYPKVDFEDKLNNALVLYVNYFGICQYNIKKLLRKIPKDKLIIDNSHALFAPHLGELATIYSPRKFVGLPDGGLLKASQSLKISPPEVEDIGSLNRMNYLFTRLAYSAKEGYEGFNNARLSLENSRPLKMSRLTTRLMQSISWSKTAERRKKNYALMAKELDSINSFPQLKSDNEVPLCYPLMLSGYDVTNIKLALSQANIFTPTYWLDAVIRIKANSIEYKLIKNTLFLPIDQRLDAADIKLICKQVTRLITNLPLDNEE